MNDKISYDEFKKVELKVARILSAERVEGSDKLVRLELDLGEDPSTGLGQVRQIVAGIGKVYSPETLVGREIVIVANLEPRSLMGLESNGMLLAADSGEGPALLIPDKDVLPGCGIK